ncbi:hypothetical protein Cal6303_5425 [Calothrix sp. PCC 6303]|nr:hypothetical protein Cal6303_5425 [Calothrix sp. PCC 6303]
MKYFARFLHVLSPVLPAEEFVHRTVVISQAYGTLRYAIHLITSLAGRLRCTHISVQNQNRRRSP